MSPSHRSVSAPTSPRVKSPALHPPPVPSKNRFSLFSDAEEPENEDEAEATAYQVVTSPKKLRISTRSTAKSPPSKRNRSHSTSSNESFSSSRSTHSNSSSRSGSGSSSRSRSPSPAPPARPTAGRSATAPNRSGPQPQKTRISPLFVEVSDAEVDTAVIHNQLIPLTTKRIRTPKGSLLVYPKNEEARTTLISSSFQGFSCRPTLGSQRKTSRMDPAGPPPKQNLFVVARTVDRKYSDEQLTQLLGRTSTRMYSATAGGHTGSIRIQCTSQEDKAKILKEGLSFNFRKHKVDDYRQSGPRQCFKCQAFGHLASSCTGPMRCKNCSGDHSHTDCKATSEETQLCPNCNGSHPSTFKGCPAYKTAREKQAQDQMTYAQKATPRPSVMESVRLATALSEGIFVSLKPSIQEIKREDIYTSVANIVSVVYRTRVTASQMLSTFPTFA